VKRTRRCRCLCCQKLFRADPRTRGQQKYCGEALCRAASKRASQSRWSGKPENGEYFSGPHHVSRVRAWREAHPGYGRKRRIARSLLQETRRVQVAEQPQELTL